MRAHIISIGNEILLGEVVDTNSAWVADALTNMGIRVERALSVGDDRLAILEALSTSVGVTDFVFVTGGLGPTSDDITKDVLSECFDAPLVLDETVEKIRDKEMMLTRRFIEGAREIPGLTLYGGCDEKKQTSTVSFTLDGISQSEAGLILDEQYDILCRVGLHCAPSAHKTIGTFPDGTVRFGMGYINTPDEIDFALEALRKMVS